MLIGELSAKTGLSRDTIRFYEKEGLIEAGKQENPYNNYKEYDSESIKRLETIRRIKGFGFTLNEVKDLLTMIDNKQASCKNVAVKVNEKAIMIEQKIKELQKLKKLIIHEVNTCPNCLSETKDQECPIFG